VSIFLSCVKLILGAYNAVSMTAPKPLVSSQLKEINLSTHRFTVNTSNLNAISTNNLPMNNNIFNKTAISAVNPNKSENSTSENPNDPLAGSYFYDNPGKPGTDSFKLYNDTAYVFKCIYQNWLKSKSELEDIASFKIPNKIVKK